MQRRIGVLSWVVAAALVLAAELLLIAARTGVLDRAGDRPAAPQASTVGGDNAALPATGWPTGAEGNADGTVDGALVGPVGPLARSTADGVATSRGGRQLEPITSADSTGGLGARTPAAATSSATATSRPPLDSQVAIIAGHWQYDTGAVCADGLREVDVTVDVALRTQAVLEYRGYQVTILPEHDPDIPSSELQNYRAAALVSIHADSCEPTAASGYKVARWRYSTMPEIDDTLAECLRDAYGRVTLLPYSADTITDDMTNYYAFREIAIETPAAIIEVGFLGSDRAFLDEHRYEMALGIADGVECFLEAIGGG